MANISNINNFFVVNTAQKIAAIGADLANNNGTPYVGVDFTVVGANSSSPVANLWLSNFTHKSYVLISDNSSNFIIRDPGADSNRLTIASGGNATFAAKVFSTSTVSGDIGTTLVTKDYVDSGDGSSINTILITVAAVGGGNRYFLDGVQQANAVLQPGFTYRFDQSNATNNGHPLRFSTNNNNSPAAPYTTGVTAVGTPGSSGAYTQIITTQATPVTLYYYCTFHSGMGGAATIRIIQTDGTGYFANNVGIGNENPSSFDADANNLVVGALGGNNGITIASGASAGNYGSIYFADGITATANKAGFIRYEQNTSEMTFGINAVKKLGIDLSGNATFAGSVTASSFVGAASTFDPMVTITYSDISTGENRGLRIVNTQGTEQIWNLTNGITGNNNEDFCIRDSTNNVNAFTLAKTSGNATFSEIANANIIVARDNMFVGAGQFYIGGTASNIDNTFRQVVSTSAGTFKLQKRISGTFTDALAFDSSLNATFSGSITVGTGNSLINGDLYFGVNADIFKSSGDFKIDVAGDISLDAGGNDIRFKVANVEFGKIKSDSGNLAIFSSIQDEDILFKGNDGGSVITALTLDMSNGGSATFRDDIDFGGKLTQTGTGANTFAGDVKLGDDKRLILGASTDGTIQYDGTNDELEIKTAADASEISLIAGTTNTYTSEIQIGARSSLQGEGIFFKTRSEQRMRITSGGQIEFAATYNNTTASAANMHISSAGGQIFRSTSSLKYKTDVRDYDKGLNEVMQLQPKYYKGKDDGDTQFAGLIAEDVNDLGLSEFVQYAEDGTPDSLAYTHMVALLVKSIQELKAEIEILKNK